MVIGPRQVPPIPANFPRARKPICSNECPGSVIVNMRCGEYWKIGLAVFGCVVAGAEIPSSQKLANMVYEGGIGPGSDAGTGQTSVPQPAQNPISLQAPAPAPAPNPQTNPRTNYQAYYSPPTRVGNTRFVDSLGTTAGPSAQNYNHLRTSTHQSVPPAANPPSSTFPAYNGNAVQGVANVAGPVLRGARDLVREVVTENRDELKGLLAERILGRHYYPLPYNQYHQPIVYHSPDNNHYDPAHYPYSYGYPGHQGRINVMNEPVHNHASVPVAPASVAHEHYIHPHQIHHCTCTEKIQENHYPIHYHQTHHGHQVQGRQIYDPMADFRFPQVF